MCGCELLANFPVSNTLKKKKKTLIKRHGSKRLQYQSAFSINHHASQVTESTMSFGQIKVEVYDLEMRLSNQLCFQNPQHTDMNTAKNTFSLS